MSQLRSRWLPLALLSAGLSDNLNAVDGVVLISQAQALAGNVTTGDAPGFRSRSRYREAIVMFPKCLY